MNSIRTGLAVAALSLTFTVLLPAQDSSAEIRGVDCARREIVATGSSIFTEMLAKVDAEVAWEIKAVSKYGPLWYSWWAAKNNRFRCRTKGHRTTCVARGAPCKLF